jgi:hypothetical protein
MADTTLLDTSILGSGPVAGFLRWHAEDTMNHKAGTFSMKNRETEGMFDLARPFTLDAWGIRTGWLRRLDKGPPERWWNPKRNEFIPKPHPDAKRFIRLAIEIDGLRYVWEQDSFAALKGALGMSALMRDAGNWKETECPRFVHSGAVPDLGDRTLVPTFKFLGRVPTPEVFNTPLPEAPSGSGTGNGTAQPPDVIHLPASTRPTGPTWDAPKGGSLDDIPF